MAKRHTVCKNSTIVVCHRPCGNGYISINSKIFNYLKTDIIDAGITFDSTARAGNLDYIHIPAAYNHKETAPLIRLTNGENRENTTLFTEFIFANMGVFEKYGFTVAGR